jgi:hypothetical protein
MDWLNIVKIIGMIATAVFIGFLIRELIKNIKESKDGKVSERCDLD